MEPWVKVWAKLKDDIFVWEELSDLTEARKLVKTLKSQSEYKKMGFTFWVEN